VFRVRANAETDLDAVKAAIEEGLARFEKKASPTASCSG
jgi:hypothetical protein